MSIRVMSRVWDSAPYSEDTLLTFLALADWADDEGGCFPSIQQIALKSRQCERNAKRCIRRLVDDGFLSITEAGGGRGKRPSYRINIDKLTSFQKPKGDIVNIKRVTLCTVKGDIDDIAIRKNRQEPSEEPSEVHSDPPPASGKDSRYVPFMDALSKYWAFKCPNLKFSPSPADCKQLKRLLENNRGMTDEQFKICLNHRARSEMVHSQAFGRWIGRVQEFFNGPLDQYWHLKIGVNGNGQISKSEQRSQRNDEKYARIVSKLSAGNGRNLPLGINGNGNGNLHSGSQGLPDGGNNGVGKTIDAESSRGLVGHPKAT